MKMTEANSQGGEPDSGNTKHPLQNVWQMWYYKKMSTNYENNLTKITSVSTVEDFWGLYNHLEYASQLKQNYAYYFFKEGIRPMWEDDINKDGGRWLINCKKDKQTDNNWLEILLLLIGEAFGEHCDQICGAFVIIKGRYDKVGVWTKTTDRDAMMYIGNLIKKSINFTGPISFESHDNGRRVVYDL